MQTDNLSHLRKFILMLARESGKILRTGYYKSKSITSKGDQGIVTDTDFRAENKLISLIHKKYPLHHILGEESGKVISKKSLEMQEKNNSGINKKNKDNPDKFHSDYLWIIDPLDGTTNFAHNYQQFCTSIALAYREKVILGAVFNPITNELFFAEKYKGAFLNNQKISVSKRKLKHALLCTGFAYKRDHWMHNNLRNIGAILARGAQGVRIDGTAALDLCYVACGKFDGFWESNLNSWDIAAGCLIVEEAGGKVTNDKSKPWKIHDRNIVASNKIVDKDILKIIKKR